MRFLLVLAVSASVLGCQSVKPNVKPLPPERQDATLSLKFYPPKNPEPDELFVCGLSDGFFQCVEWSLFQEQLEKSQRQAGRGVAEGSI